MPVHDWTRVDAGIFHAFHHGWISSIGNAFNDGLLPKDYYALPEQYAGGFGPDVLALETTVRSGEESMQTAEAGSSDGGTALAVAPPRLAPTAETELEFYHRKQSTLVIHHVTGDRVVAMVEIVSPGNKSSTSAMRAFIEKASSMIQKGVHLLIIDLLPPGPRNPEGIHGVIWDDVTGQKYQLPADKRLTVVAYEADLALRAYVQHFSVGGNLPDMPLFLAPNACVEAPLETTYSTAFAAMPLRWRRVLEASAVPR